MGAEGDTVKEVQRQNMKTCDRGKISGVLLYRAPSGFFCRLDFSGRSAVYCPRASLSLVTDTLGNYGCIRVYW